jgi:hypothetical protein
MVTRSSTSIEGTDSHQALEVSLTGIFAGMELTSLFILTVVLTVVWGILLPLRLATALG